MTTAGNSIFKSAAIRSIFLALAALAILFGCSNSPPSTGTGLHSCADCTQAAACCQAVLAAMGDTTSQCSTSEDVCSSIDDLEEQREYIQTCDAYLMKEASGDAAPAACQ